MPQRRYISSINQLILVLEASGLPSVLWLGPPLYRFSKITRKNSAWRWSIYVIGECFLTTSDILGNEQFCEVLVFKRETAYTYTYCWWDWTIMSDRLPISTVNFWRYEIDWHLIHLCSKPDDLILLHLCACNLNNTFRGLGSLLL